jgi:hypothetical protein
VRTWRSPTAWAELDLHELQKRGPPSSAYCEPTVPRLITRGATGVSPSTIPTTPVCEFDAEALVLSCTGSAAVGRGPSSAVWWTRSAVSHRNRHQSRRAWRAGFRYAQQARPRYRAACWRRAGWSLFSRGRRRRCSAFQGHVTFLALLMSTRDNGRFLQITDLPCPLQTPVADWNSDVRCLELRHTDAIRLPISTARRCMTC